MSKDRVSGSTMNCEREFSQSLLAGWTSQGRPDRGTPDSSGIRVNRVWGCRMNPAFRWQRPLVPCHWWPHFQILFAEQRARN